MDNKTYNTAHMKKIENEELRAFIYTLWLWKAKDGIIIVQKALKSLGSHITVDGWLGDKTLNAIERYVPTTLHGAIAYEISMLQEAKEPHYLTIARAELGVKEIKGKKHNRRVLKYHAVSGGFKTDEVPWCGSFVNWVMKEAGYKTVKYPARAKSWRKFGKGTRNPYLGSVAVKSRKGGGHVCFVVGKSKNGKYLYCLGGNQGDAVSIRKYRADAFTDFRLPKDAEPIALSVYKNNAKLAQKES